MLALWRSQVGRLLLGFAAALCLLTLALGFDDGAARAAESTPRGLTTSNFKIYSVRMDTTVRAPATGPRCINVRVWHALPTHRPWSQMASPYGTLDQHAQPAGSILEAENDKRSTHILWNTKNGQLPNQEIHYISEFRVVSPDRRFDPSTCHLIWSDILRYAAENKVNFPTQSTEVSLLCDRLKYNKQPVDTIIEFSKWLKENFTYDASVTTPGDDVVGILTARRGHCLHLATVFGALCTAAQIPWRPVKGLNLHFPTGNSDIDQSRNDYTNGHVWGEVYLPDVGWIEVEPFGGEKCFVIPANYIQNNTSFQNYAVWVWEQGSAPRTPRWVLRGGKYVSDYGVDHRITFTESRR